MAFRDGRRQGQGSHHAKTNSRYAGDRPTFYREFSHALSWHRLCGKRAGRIPLDTAQLSAQSLKGRDFRMLPATPAECRGTFLLGLGFAFVTAPDAVFDGLGGLVVEDNKVTKRPVVQCAGKSSGPAVHRQRTGAVVAAKRSDHDHCAEEKAGCHSSNKER